MKWFKHDSNASIDAKIEKLIDRYGLEGYGLYFYCLELIARNVEAHNLTFELEHDALLIARRLYMNADEVQSMMSYMVDLGLFELSAGGTVTCLKMATRTDEYTQKLLSKNKNVTTLSRLSPDNVPTMSRANPDSVGRKSELIEEKRREEKRLATPDGVDPTAWAEFDEFRNSSAKLRKGWSDLAKKKSANLLRQLSFEQQRLCVDYSIRGGYTGLFTDRFEKPKPVGYDRGQEV